MRQIWSHQNSGVRYIRRPSASFLPQCEQVLSGKYKPRSFRWNKVDTLPIPAIAWLNAFPFTGISPRNNSWCQGANGKGNTGGCQPRCSKSHAVSRSKRQFLSAPGSEYYNILAVIIFSQFSFRPAVRPALAGLHLRHFRTTGI